MQGHKLKKISDENIGSLLTRPGLTLLLITSSWDGNGVIVRTLIEGIAGSYANVGFVTADVEESPKLCKLFNIVNPPGLLFLREGELVNRVTGAVSGGTIRSLIESIS